MTRSLILAVAVLAVAVGCEQKEKKKRDVNLDALGVDLGPPPKPIDTTPPSGSGGGSTSVRGNTNFQAGAGAVQNIRKAGQRAATLNDMQQLGIFIKQMDLDNNKMPQPAEVKEYIRRDAAKLLALIDDGTIILTGTRDRGGLWAYETEADKLGGIGLVNGTANRYSADDIKQMLGK